MEYIKIWSEEKKIIQNIRNVCSKPINHALCLNAPGFILHTFSRISHNLHAEHHWLANFELRVRLSRQSSILIILSTSANKHSVYVYVTWAHRFYYIIIQNKSQVEIVGFLHLATDRISFIQLISITILILITGLKQTYKEISNNIKMIWHKFHKMCDYLIMIAVYSYTSFVLPSIEGNHVHNVQCVLFTECHSMLIAHCSRKCVEYDLVLIFLFDK